MKNVPYGLDSGRWIVGRNRSRETAPPYSVVSMLPDLASRRDNLHVMPDGSIEINFYKPRDVDEHLQDHHFLAITGSQPILAGREGLVTKEFPCIARVATRSAPAGGWAWPYYSVGAARDSWTLETRPFGAFHIIPVSTVEGWSAGHDVLAMLTSPLPFRSSYARIGSSSASPVIRGDGQSVPLGVSSGYWRDHFGIRVSGGDGNERIILNTSGSYVFSFDCNVDAGESGRITGGSASVDARLQATIEDLDLPSPGSGSRAVDLPYHATYKVPESWTDQITNAPLTTEIQKLSYQLPVSFGGFMNLRRNAVFGIKIVSPVKRIVFTTVSLLIERVGPYISNANQLGIGR